MLQNVPNWLTVVLWIISQPYEQFNFMCCENISAISCLEKISNIHSYFVNVTWSDKFHNLNINNVSFYRFTPDSCFVAHKVQDIRSQFHFLFDQIDFFIENFSLLIKMQCSMDEYTMRQLSLKSLYPQFAIGGSH